MCLIVFAWQVVPGAPLVACANRDEFYDRPTSAAAPWPEHPAIYAAYKEEVAGILELAA